MPTTGANLSRYIDRARKRASDYVDPMARQICLLKELNELTGSTFSAFNLCDAFGRMLGGSVWPLTAEKEEAVRATSERLSALISMDETQAYFFQGDLGCIKVMPQPLYRSSALYQEVYRHLGMEFVAWYIYPRLENGDLVIVGISSSERDFDSTALRRFERFCREFENEIVTIAPSGERLPVVTPRMEDHVTLLDRDLRPTAPLPDYLKGALLYFYGSPTTDASELPATFINEICKLRETRSEGLIPTASRNMIAWHRRRRGRQLNLVLSPAAQGYRLECHEDYTASQRLQQVKEKCESLKRDGASVFAVAQVLLDGVAGDETVLAAANLGALKPSSAKRIISKARAIVGSV